MSVQWQTLFFSFLLVFALTTAPRPLDAETLVGTNVDERLIVAFAARPDGLESFVPEGFAPIAFPQGPMAGANVLLVLIDRLVQLDASGEPAGPSNSRYAVLAGLAQREGEPPRLLVYRIYASDLSANPYSNSLEATIERRSATEGPANLGRQREEDWSIIAADGDMRLELTFESGQRSWGAAEAMPYSAAVPDFYRIYRYNQLVDLVASAALSRPIGGAVAFATTIPELEGLFDGSEEIRAILDVPVYTREVYLP